MSGLTGYLTSDGTDLSFIFLRRTDPFSIIGFSHVVHRFPIIGDTQFGTTLNYTTTSTSTYVAALVTTTIYNPLTTQLIGGPAAGATRFYRLFAVYSDDMQNSSGPAFQIRFNFVAGTPTTQTFSFTSTFGLFGRRISNSDRQTIVNGNHATVSFVIPNGVTGKRFDGGNLAQVNVKITYLEIQYIDQY
jgi:hypothetical protein